MLEAYQAFADYHDMMDLIEAIVLGGGAGRRRARPRSTVDGQEVDLAPPWRRATMAELIEGARRGEMHPSMPADEARAIADAPRHVRSRTSWGAGKIMAEVYDETCEAKLIEPTFVLDHPREVSPLARAHRDDPTLIERFEVVVAGRELANAYSELNDPVDQRERFEAEARAEGRRRRGGRGRRRGLHPRARVRPAADRRARHRDRPAGDADRRSRRDPRGDPLPHHAPRGRGGAPRSRLPRPRRRFPRRRRSHRLPHPHRTCRRASTRPRLRRSPARLHRTTATPCPPRPPRPTGRSAPPSSVRGGLPCEPSHG